MLLYSPGIEENPCNQQGRRENHPDSYHQVITILRNSQGGEGKNVKNGVCKKLEGIYLISPVDSGKMRIFLRWEPQKARHFARRIRECWREVDATVEECLDLLSSLCGVRVVVRGSEIYTIPRPRAELGRLFKLSGVVAPKVLPKGDGGNAGGVGGKVDTNRKLTSRRKSK